MSHHRTSRVAGSAAVVLALALVAAACGDDDTGATTAATEAPTTTQAEQTTTSAAGSDVIEVIATDFAFAGLPERVQSGATFDLRNVSNTELHEMVFFQLAGHEARSIEEIAQLPPEQLELVLGAPSAVILAPPGEAPSVTVVGTGQLNGTGRYAVFCFIPTGADPEEYITKAATSDGPPDVEGGPPHFVEGMFTELIVEP